MAIARATYATLLAGALVAGCASGPMDGVEDAAALAPDGVAEEAPTANERPISTSRDLQFSGDAVGFAGLVEQYSSGDESFPRSLDELLDWSQFVATGDIVGFEQGRDEFLFADPGVVEDVDPEALDKTPAGVGYQSHVNLIIEIDEVLQGKLADPEAALVLEFPWPNNLSTDELRSSAPIGQQVVLLGEIDGGALKRSQPLIDMGLLDPESVSPNTFVAPTYGVVVYSADRAPVLLRADGLTLQEAGKLIGLDIESADDLVAAIRKLVEQ